MITVKCSHKSCLQRRNCVLGSPDGNFRPHIIHLDTKGAKYSCRSLKPGIPARKRVRRKKVTPAVTPRSSSTVTE